VGPFPGWRLPTRKAYSHLARATHRLRPLPGLGGDGYTMRRVEPNRRKGTPDVLKGLGDLKNVGGMLKQAMEVKQNIEALKATLGDERIEASSGGGMVTVVVSGKMEVLSVKIDPEVVDKNEVEMLETLVQAAVNEAAQKMKALVQEKMREVAGGIDIPGLT